MIVKKYGNLFRCTCNGIDVIAPSRREAVEIMTKIIWGEK